MAMANFTAMIGANIKEFQNKIKQAQQQAQQFQMTDIAAEITANINAFRAKIAQARAQLNQFDRGSVEAEIDANTNRFTARLLRAKAQAQEFARNKIVSRITANISGFTNRLAAVRTAISAIDGKKIVIEVEARIERFQNTIGRIASNVRAFQELMGNTLRGAFISLSSTAAPILASIGGLIGALGPMIGTVAGSAFALGTAFVGAGAAAGAFAAVAVPTIKKLFDENTKLNAAQQKAKSSFDGFKKTYQGIVKEMEKPVLQAFTTGMQAANQILQMSKPLFASSAKAVNNLMTSLKQSLGTPPIQAFFDYLNKDAGPLLEVTGKSVGNLFRGLMSMMVAFGPLAMNTANGFLQMSRNFATWADGLSESKKFQSFVSYINENMPKVRAIFRDALAGITYFFSAFSPLSAGMMSALQEMMARFKEWSASLSQNQGFQTFVNYVKSSAPSVISLIGNITTFLVNLGIGLAPLGAKLLELTNKFIGWVNGMMQAHPVIGQIVAVLVTLTGALIAIVPNVVAFSTLFSGLGGVITSIGSKIGTFITGGLARLFPAFANASTATGLLRTAFSLLGGPIGIAIAAITGFIAVLVAVYNSNETFRAQVQTVWEAIKTIITTAITAISTFITSIWSQITAFWTENQTAIMSIAQVIWTGIQTVITTAMTVIMTIISAVWPFIQLIIQSAWEAIKNVIQGALDIILGAIKLFSSLLTADWQAAWDGVKQIVNGALRLIWGLINLHFLSKFLGPLKGFASQGKSIISSAWNAIKSIFSNTLNAIKTLVTNGFNAVKNTTKNVMDSIKSLIQTIWNSIKSTITSVLNGIKSVVTSVWNAIKATITSVMNAIRSAVTSAWNAIRSTVTSVMSGIKSAIQSGWNAAKSVVTSSVNAIKSIVTSVFNSLKSVVSSAMTGVKSAIVNGWNAAKSFLSSINLSGIGRNIIQGLINGIGSMMGAVQDKISSIANTIKNGIKSALSIHSPSRWMRDVIGVNVVSGIIVGIDNMKNRAYKSAARMAEWFRPQLSDIKISRSSLDVGLPMDELKRQIDQKLDVDLWIHQKEGKAAAGFKQEVHLHSPTALSPAENARALKKVGQQQALEWGV